MTQLAASGITAEFAALRGYETIHDFSEDFERLMGLGFSKRASGRVPGLLIPQLDVQQEEWGHQFRPDCSERHDNYTIQKYETPHRQRNGLDIPPGVGQLLDAPGEQLWIVEGTKKADCAALHELCAVSVSGVWNFVGTNRYRGKVALPDWRDVALNNREVIIAYDGDVARKQQVRQAMGELAGYLKLKGAEVSCLWLPDEDEKVGLDDYLVAGHTIEELWQLVRPYDFRLDGDPGQPKRSAASTIVDLARDTYRLGVTDTGEPFGTRGYSHVAVMLRGGATSMRAELASRYFEAHDSAPPQSALTDACAVLEGFARRAQPQPVHLRVAREPVLDNVYIDMGDPGGHVICIVGGGWHIAGWGPMLFRRPKPMRAMPVPVPGGDLARLWEAVPIDEEDRPLVLAWLVSALIQPDVAHPILALLAEHGSVKTTATKRLVCLVDPTEPAVRMVPRNADAWVTAANASWVMGLDNLSGPIPLWLSDCLCRSSTGDGDIRRQLYTDSDVAVFGYRRVVVFNGIDVVVTQGDLADRLLRVRLPRVTDGRRTDAQVDAEWAEAHPQILGGLLDLAATVHQRLRTIEVDDLPRMADYAMALACVDEVLGTEGLDHYRQLSDRTATDTLDHPFIAALIRCRYQARGVPAKDILSDMNSKLSALLPPPAGWPKGAQSASGQLTRHAPAMRAAGWTVDSDGGHNHEHTSLWTITPPPKVEEEEGGRC